ncbi:AAA family ATPase [Clostridium sporogenes]|uniref:AAA-like domain-containing protein n=1 Tax=unclassified Clostridium TaxID=2614128 RepID=UPI0013D70CB9|nr:AAA family ATPase [Clostridium sporogenes]NFS26353.1 AAA family ATPase [Clostridium sporogenes]
MKKRFNVTGTCIPEKHYMVNISNKLDSILKLVNNEEYFIINRPRQYGKTTTLYLLEKRLNTMEEYLPIKISFEAIDAEAYSEVKKFLGSIMMQIVNYFRFSNNKEMYKFIKNHEDKIITMNDFNNFITDLVEFADKKVVLIIDEVDKSSNNQLFLDFLGMLRSKYLLRNEGKDYTFHSVILAGVHDIKTLKLKIRSNEEHKYNSPWNIAVDFDVNMSFSSEEISTMLIEYSKHNNLNMNIKEISEEIYLFTNGYPFLVSRICQIIDEKINKENKKSWDKTTVRQSVKIINEEVNTLFESIVKNLENNIEIYELTKRILVDGEQIIFNPLDPTISIGLTYGIFKKGENGVEISNKIFEEIVYNYMISKIRTSAKNMSLYNIKSSFIKENGELNIKKVLQRFQQFMKEQYSSKDEEFLEHHGRLLFLAFIKPIINGTGFDFKEVQVSEEKRLDLVITYNNFKYIIEMKIWRGDKYHKDGINQFCDYLDIHGLNKGYLLVFNFNKNKEFKEERINIKEKDIFIVFV